MAGLTVTAALVTIRTKNDRVSYLYHGDVVPDEATSESVQLLKDLGFVTSGDVDDVTPEQPAPVAPEPVAGPVEKPAGNASLEAWQAYAAGQGVQDVEGKTRDELRDLLK